MEGSLHGRCLPPRDFLTVMQISTSPLRLQYFIRIPNVGDLVNPAVVSALAGVPTRWSISGPRLVAIGSVMSGATPTSIVWGTGVMSPTIGVGNAIAGNIYALRGKLSHEALRQHGVALPDMPLGDPGYLAPALLGAGRSQTPRYRLGLVPHYVDRPNPDLWRFGEDHGVKILNVHDEPRKFFREMGECAAVASSSLHGLIFAEAMGIPNVWITLGGEIGGGDFKFRDWFSTTADPQEQALAVRDGWQPETLIDAARLHGSTIVERELAASFPVARLDELRDAERPLIPTDVCRGRPTPVFLISFNRGQMLTQAMDAVRKLSRPTEIVIHDNGSDDPDTVAILASLEGEGVQVHRWPKISSASELSNVNTTIQQYFANWAEPVPYVVSDCDIDMSIASPDAVDMYEELLTQFRKVGCVGPMLRIRDVPTDYPMYGHVMNRHIAQFWGKEPEWADTTRGQVALQMTKIDTTFALHRAGEPFKRMKDAVRVYEPYEAMHLDWYSPSVGHGAYSTSSNPDIAHWDNLEQIEKHRDTDLAHSELKYVTAGPDGKLTVKTMSL